MPIVVDIDVMLAKRKMSVGELADRVGITPANLAVLKNGRAKAVRFTTLDALCGALECQPGESCCAGRPRKPRTGDAGRRRRCPGSTRRRPRPPPSDTCIFLYRCHSRGMSSQSTTSGAMDRRVRRSRTAIMRAAVELVSARGTSNVAVSDIADAADVSRPLVYQQFGDRDALLLEAALDLAKRELIPLAEADPTQAGERDRILAGVRHFAQYRSFYRAMLTGSCGYALTKAQTDLLVPLNQRIVHQMPGGHRDPDLVADLAGFITAGAAGVFNTWIIEGEDPLDPEAFTDRLMRMLTAITTTESTEPS
jgi:DNA-binding Xre family transcriptional regulator/AcrR family transcriptional regulator